MNQKFVVCLDAGHYGKYNRSPVVPEYYESDMVWTLQQLLKQQLEQRGITVITTRADKNKNLALDERGKKSKGADLFLSLHSNAASTEKPDWVVGICHRADSNSNIDERSREIATALSAAVAKVMGVSYQITTKASSTDRDGDGRLDDYYGVLRGAYSVGTPGVILEHGFHTHKTTAQWLLEQKNLKKLAEAEATSIAAWLGLGADKMIVIQLPQVKQGSNSDTIRALQALLVGYGADIAVDGIFGPATDKAVRTYQAANALVADGIVGTATWTHLLGR
jgi:N-acetylmuramoyl-L-alanine amidase